MSEVMYFGVLRSGYKLPLTFWARFCGKFCDLYASIEDFEWRAVKKSLHATGWTEHGLCILEWCHSIADISELWFVYRAACLIA